MTQSAIATAADYADALLSARRFKSVLFLILLLTLLIELTLFFVAWSKPGLLPKYVPQAVEVSASTTQPVGASKAAALLQYLTVLCGYLGMISSIILTFVLLLITTIMLVGRLIGVGRLTSAFIWSVLLVTLLFPWQSILQNPVTTNAPPTGSTSMAPSTDFRIPGVLYTWEELSHPTLGAQIPSSNPSVATLRWARYVGFPFVAIICLFAIQVKSNRGLRQALGETRLPETMTEDVPPA